MKILIFRNFRTQHWKVWPNGEAKEFMAPLLGTSEGWEICTLSHENILFFCAALCYGKHFCCFLEGDACIIKGNLEGFELQSQC